jgi:hypothetical protein
VKKVKAAKTIKSLKPSSDTDEDSDTDDTSDQIVNADVMSSMRVPESIIEEFNEHLSEREQVKLTRTGRWDIADSKGKEAKM